MLRPGTQGKAKAAVAAAGLAALGGAAVQLDRGSGDDGGGAVLDGAGQACGRRMPLAPSARSEGTIASKVNATADAGQAAAEKTIHVEVLRSLLPCARGYAG